MPASSNIPVTAAQALGASQDVDETGATVQIEKICITDGGGSAAKIIVPLSEATGQLILAQLNEVTRLLAMMAQAEFSVGPVGQ